MFVGQWINFARDGITTKLSPENIVELVHECKNVCLTLFVPLDMLRS